MSDSMFPPNVFDRLLKDRIIWLGSEVRDDNANEIAAKLLPHWAVRVCNRDPGPAY